LILFHFYVSKRALNLKQKLDGTKMRIVLCIFCILISPRKGTQTRGPADTVSHYNILFLIIQGSLIQKYSDKWNSNYLTESYNIWTFSAYSFVQLGLNEADTVESSSILIYSHSEQSIYTQWDRHDA